MKKISIFFLLSLLLQSAPTFATPTETGITGLLRVPTADTLDAGNICVGIWGNLSKTGEHHAVIMPVTLTLGIGSFWELYGTYPNVLLNGQDDRSGRGTADLGTKIRFWGSRSAKFKLAGDVFLQRHISDDLSTTSKDGLTDFGGRLIATYKGDLFGAHLFGGYLSPSEPSGISYKDEIHYGGGIEFNPTPRMMISAEILGSQNRDRSLDAPLEGSLGFQYHISPHLTFNVSTGAGFSDASPDWRVILGFSTCQGFGTYIKPVPKVETEEDKKKAKQEVVKPVKIIPITSQMVKSQEPVVPSSSLEVPVDQDKEEVIIRPYGQIIIAPQATETRPVVPSVKPPVSGSEGLETSPLYGFEIKGGKSATTELADTLKVYRKFRFPDIVGYFEPGKFELSADAKKLLSELAIQIRNDSRWSFLRIEGYTDNIGSSKYNSELSLKRAIEVANYLITREGIDSTKIFVKGMGKTKQIADNSTEQGRKQNNRFEILLLQKEGN